MKKRFIVIVVVGALVLLAALWGASRHFGWFEGDVAESIDSFVYDESVPIDLENKTIEMRPLESQLWVDNFLSSDHKDTLRVCLWSETINQFIKEVPNDTTENWWCWYQDQRVKAVLYLQDIKPLCLPYVHALAQCYPITEGGKRAVVILPYAAQPSNWVQCHIYTISNKKWAKLKSFGMALWDDCAGSESLKKCLIKKNGRWMYADQFDIDIEPKENPYQYIFD